MDSSIIEKELRAREPIFHRSGPSASRGEFEDMLNQDGRLTRRSTIWRSTPTDWRAEYHQGTNMPARED